MVAITADTAARQLASELALPPSRGSVFAWFDPAGAKIVIRAERSWLRRHPEIPNTYLGFTVETDEPSGAVAFRSNRR